MNIADRLKAIRTNLGLTQMQVSQRSGMDDSTISSFETGRAEPRLGQLAKLSEVYRLPLSHFFNESDVALKVVLWRNEPENKTDIQAEFLELCRQYRQLEAWTDDTTTKQLPNIDIPAGRFHYPEVQALATEVRQSMGLGQRPGQSLKLVLEEIYGIKIFHLDLDGAGIAASCKSDDFGNAILLNKGCSRWRRNHDLAHELFHLFTWDRFKHNDQEASPSEQEEKYATCFAGNLLLPEEVVDTAIKTTADENGKVSFDQLDKIAREFDVSLESLLWRMHFLYNSDQETTKDYIAQAREYVKSTPRASGEEPEAFPERYRALAIKALRDGSVSLGRFAKFMRISRAQAEKYISGGEFNYAATTPVAV